MNKPMNQRYHVVFKGKSVTTRRPWKGPSVELYSSSGRFNDDGELVVPAMFGRHEIRQFLEDLGPFSIVSVDSGNPAKVREILEEGLDITDPDTQDRTKWYVAGYFVRDEGTTLIMLPNETTDAQFFGHLGLRVDLESKWGNSFKVGKYMKRLYSHHREVMRGTVVSKGDGDVIIVKLDNGKAISVRYADHGKLVDGMNLVSKHCMKMMGLKAKVGAGLRITALSPKGFSKGHAIVLDHLKFDLVLFNSKKMLFGEKFFFAVDWLHTGKLFTDVQSVINFQMDDASFLTDWSHQFMLEVMEALTDQEKLRKMLRFYEIDFHKYDRGDHEGEFIEKEKDWSLLRAMRGGVDHVKHPALMRKMFHLFVDKVMKCETDIRIPVPENIGGARYALVDPTIFDENGDPTLDGQLSGNTVHCEAFSGDIVFHRQPNGHRGEHHIAKAVPNLFLERMDTGCFLFMSKDMVVDALSTLGGGDQDDRLVYYKDQAVVEHFLMLKPYPVQVFVEKPEIVRKLNAFAAKLRRPTYDRTQLLVMLDMMKKQRVHIGQAVNPLLHDASLTDHKEEIITYMVNTWKNPTVKEAQAIEWMRQYPGNVLAGVASRLEIVIDSVKKEGSDISEIASEIKRFNDTFQVVCRFNTKGGKYEGRVPTSRRGDNYPVIVECNIDRVMDSIQQERADLEEAVIDLSWQMLEQVPAEVLTQPLLEGSKDLAYTIRRTWGMLWADARSVMPKAKNRKEEVDGVVKYYKTIDEKMDKMFGTHPMIVDAFAWLYQIIYENRMPEAPRDKGGKAEPFRDGILWGPRLSKYTIKALELCGVAGRYVDVQWYDDVDVKKLNKECLDIKLDNGVVTLMGSNVQVGMIDPSPDEPCDSKLEKGLVYVPARDVYPYEPALTVDLLCVVNGLQEKGATHEQIVLWKTHVHEHVKLVPYLYEGEHAVRVVLDDNTQHGNLTVEDAVYVTKETDGWLMPGKVGESYTMQVAIRSRS